MKDDVKKQMNEWIRPPKNESINQWYDFISMIMG